MTFGFVWSGALVDGCRGMGVPFEYPLTALAIESGFNPNARNPSGAQGLWQKMPTVVKDKQGNVVQRIPYTEKDPVRQIKDAFAFWRSMAKQFAPGGQVVSREAFYCLNLAPARLRKSVQNGDRTVLYSSRKDLHPEEFWLAGYQQNKGLDVGRKGWIEMGDLKPKLDHYVKANQERYDLELALACIVNASR